VKLVCTTSMTSLCCSILLGFGVTCADKSVRDEFLTWGGSDEVYASDVVVDQSGNKYIAGAFDGTVDFDPGPGELERNSDAREDSYLLKLDSENRISWVLTGDRPRSGSDVFRLSMDGASNIYLCGELGDITAWGYSDQAFLVGNLSDDESLLAKVSPQGQLLWAVPITLGSLATVFGLAVSDTGESYICGDVPTSRATRVDRHDKDAFVAKFDNVGRVVWERIWGGEGWDVLRSIAVSDTGDVFACGHFSGSVDFERDSSIPPLTSSNPLDKWSWDAFLVKIGSEGNFAWARDWKGPGLEEATAIAVTPSDSVFVTGTFDRAISFGLPGFEAQYSSSGGTDIFVSKLDVDGNPEWITTFGGDYFDEANDISAPSEGKLYIVGRYWGTSGPAEGFISRLGDQGHLDWLRKFEAIRANAVALGPDGAVWIAGEVLSAQEKSLFDAFLKRVEDF